jgi:hypothetical protein
MIAQSFNFDVEDIGWKCWGCGEEFTSFDDFLAHEGLPECHSVTAIEVIADNGIPKMKIINSWGSPWCSPEDNKE